MRQDQKDKIAAANKGKHLTQATKDKIAAALARYWASLPYKPTDDAQGTGHASALYTPAEKQIQAATGQEPTQPPRPPRSTGTTKQPQRPQQGKQGNTGNTGYTSNTGNITYY